MLRIDQILNNGRFRLTKFIAEHESGTMYEAIDAVNSATITLLQRPRQLGKVTTQARLSEMNAEFESEVDSLMRLRHDRIVKVRGRFAEVDNQFLILEPIENVATELIDDDDRRPAMGQLNEWSIGLLSALEYLHSRLPEVVFGGIAPSSIVITENGVAKLLVTQTIAADQRHGNTANGVSAYQPIEALWNDLGPSTQRVLMRDQDEDSAAGYDKPTDERSDIYSLAACIYHLLTRVAPCDALERAITLVDGKPDPLREPVEIDIRIPPIVSKLLVKALSIKREDRFASVAAMLSVYQAAIESKADLETIADERRRPVEAASRTAATFETKVAEPLVANDPIADAIRTGNHSNAKFELNDSDDDLLEIEPIAIKISPIQPRQDVYPTPSIQNPTVSVNTPDLPPALAEKVPAEPVSEANIDPIETPVSEAMPARSKARFAAMAAAAAVLVTVGVVAFNFISGAAVTSQAESIAAPQMLAEPVLQPEATAVLPEPAIAVEPATLETQPAIDEQPSRKPVAATDRPARPQVSATENERGKKPAPERTPKPKKALTVDDLLNDN